MQGGERAKKRLWSPHSPFYSSFCVTGQFNSLFNAVHVLFSSSVVDVWVDLLDVDGLFFFLSPAPPLELLRERGVLSLLSPRNIILYSSLLPRPTPFMHGITSKCNDADNNSFQNSSKERLKRIGMAFTTSLATSFLRSFSLHKILKYLGGQKRRMIERHTFSSRERLVPISDLFIRGEECLLHSIALAPIPYKEPRFRYNDVRR